MPSQQQQQQRGQHASLKAQAGALYRKNAVYQRRNLCSNICLLSAPIFFCIMLLAVQVAINRLLLTGEDYEVCIGEGWGEESLCRERIYEVCSVARTQQCWRVGW